MDTLRLTLLFLHLVGFAVLLGGFAQVWNERRINGVILTGAITMAVTGPTLVVVREALELPVLETKIATKAAIAALIAIVAIVGWVLPRRPPWAYYAVGLLALLNLGFAVFWR